jgi:hypothetical protein
MNQQEQLIRLIAANAHSVNEIEAIHTRCCIYYGVEKAFEESQEIIEFANQAQIGLRESFRLQVEISEEVSGLAIKRGGLD